MTNKETHNIVKLAEAPVNKSSVCVKNFREVAMLAHGSIKKNKVSSGTLEYPVAP